MSRPHWFVRLMGSDWPLWAVCAFIVGLLLWAAIPEAWREFHR